MPEPMKVEMQDVPVTPTPESQKPVAETPKVEPKYVKLEDLEKVNQAINNTREWNNRKILSLEQKIDQLLAYNPKPEKTGNVDLDELAVKDWQAAVRELTRRELEEYSKKTQVQTKEQQELAELEQSKKQVLEKHPDLADPDSPKTKEFLRVLDENPRWKTYTDGPIIAMREMENRLKPHGNMELGDSAMRENRSKATSIPKGTSTKSRGQYSLTPADMEFCKLNGVNPESFKQFKGLREAEA